MYKDTTRQREPSWENYLIVLIIYYSMKSGAIVINIQAQQEQKTSSHPSNSSILIKARKATKKCDAVTASMTNNTVGRVTNTTVKSPDETA